MKHKVFLSDELKILLNPEKWHVIASFLPKSTQNAPDNSGWSREHTEAHNFREFLFVLSGRGTCGYCGKSYHVKPGTIILADSMEPHDRGYPHDEPPGRHLIFSFERDQCSVNLWRIGGVQTRIGCEHIWFHAYPMISLGLASTDIFFPDSTSSAPTEATNRRCSQALQLLVTTVVEQSYLPDVLEYHDGTQESTILSIMEHIRQRHGKDCQLEYLARITGYSKFHFSRLFQQYAHASLREYVNLSRVNAAKKMLQEDKPLHIIAHDLGFSHVSAFHRWRRKNGVCGRKVSDS